MYSRNVQLKLVESVLKNRGCVSFLAKGKNTWYDRLRKKELHRLVHAKIRKKNQRFILIAEINVNPAEDKTLLRMMPGSICNKEKFAEVLALIATKAHFLKLELALFSRRA